MFCVASNLNRMEYNTIAACQGDFGGPVMCGAVGTVGIQGVVSWGIGCKETNKKPTVITRVRSYIKWIRNVTGIQGPYNAYILNFQLVAAIAGGHDTKIAIHSGIVSLQRDGSHFCGAGVISANWLLTSAKCVATGAQGVSVHAGSTFTNGWGKLANGSYPKRLQVAYAPMLSREECRKYYSEELITTNMFCVAGTLKDMEKNTVAACQHDFGGPVECDAEGTYGMHGIISWTMGCKQTNNKPTVITNVYRYNEWIKNITGIK
nr:unnamed protein product [Callosobruchus analis]